MSEHLILESGGAMAGIVNAAVTATTVGDRYWLDSV